MTLLRGWTHTWTPRGFPSACFASQQPGSSPSHPSELLQQEGGACAGFLWQSLGRAHVPHSTTRLTGIQFQGNKTLTRPRTISSRPRIHQIKVGWKAALFSPPLLQSPGTKHTETSFSWDPLNQNSPPFFFCSHGNPETDSFHIQFVNTNYVCTLTGSQVNPGPATQSLLRTQAAISIRLPGREKKIKISF